MNDTATPAPDDTSTTWAGSAFRRADDRLEASFRTRDFATGARLVAAIAEVAEELGHHPDLTLTYARVDVFLSSHDAGGVTHRDLELARRIDSAAARVGVDNATGE
ncbi:4a-hydroxytetrahydrobiopterin dehydratase [Mycetocola sp. CAN_C7]|uniref:4a-hydroxytetrahydrobiopterin dehydratase n=1 Tax=Mycetocola sp. CAN_C7 TaxID=2787724 RepID=UPI0018C8F419